jgi:cytochrome P450
VKLARLPVAKFDGPRGVPLLGPMGNLMRFFGDPVKHMLALSARYGEVAPLARDDAAIVCAFGPAHTRTVLSDATRFHNMAESPVAVPADSAAARLNLNLTNQNGDAHRARRRSVMPLFERAAIASYRDAMAAEIFARPFVPGTSCNAFAAMTELTVAIAVRCLFGLEGFDAKALGALGVEYLQRLVDPMVMLAPFDLPGLPYRRYLRTATALETRILALIAERRGGDDVLSRLAASGELADTELVAQTAVFFLAGYETTASTLA